MPISMYSRIIGAVLVLLFGTAAAISNEKFRVISDIPGRSPSLHYSGKVRLVGAKSWTDAFVLQTTAGNHSDVKQAPSGYFAHLSGWSASWLSFELAEPVEVLLQRLETPVQRAVVHPASSGVRVVSVTSDGAVVSVPGPCRFTVDFDGGMDETNTGDGYTGPPIHTLSVFANSVEEQPDPSDPSVRFVKAGDEIPAAAALAPNTTLLFGPGVHHVPRADDGWRRYTLPPNVRVYVPSDAILHTAFDSGEDWGAENITLEGYGAISGEDLERCPSPPCQSNESPQGLTLRGVTKAVVRGVTFVDFPNHHIIAQATDPKRSILSNVKVLGWRANGDGVHVLGSWLVEKLFLRTQDDSLYTHSGDPKPGHEETIYDQISTWNDANGASFLITGNGTSLSNSDVLYARASWNWWSGGRSFSHRDDMYASQDILVQNVRVEDPLPSLNHFQLASDRGFLRSVRFLNISIAAPSATRTCPGFGGGCNCVPACEEGPLPFGIPNVIDGSAHGVGSIAFDGVTIGGVALSDCFDQYFNVSTTGVSNLTIDGKHWHGNGLSAIV